MHDLSDFLKHYPQVEFNIEGNPFTEFMEIARRIKPAHAHSFPTARMRSLQITVGTLTKRVNGSNQLSLNCAILESGERFYGRRQRRMGKGRELGADRVELYTQPYAEAFAWNDFDTVFEKYAVAAEPRSRQDWGSTPAMN